MKAAWLSCCVSKATKAAWLSFTFLYISKLAWLSCGFLQVLQLNNNNKQGARKGNVPVQRCCIRAYLGCLTKKFLMDRFAVTFHHHAPAALFLRQGNLNQYCPYKDKRMMGDDKAVGRNSLFPL